MPPPPSTPSPTDGWGDRLPRRLGLWSAVAVLVGSTIGGGIFRTPAVIAGRVPQPVLMLLVWVLGGLLALCGALTYAELAAMFPRSGGVYVYVREGFGRLPAFLFGWSELLLIRASALGAIATPFAEYLLRSLGLDPTRPPYDGAVHWAAAPAILLTATLNYVGARSTALPLDGTTPAQYAPRAQAVRGRLGVGLVAIVVMVATFSTLLGSMLTAPRIFFAMADDGLLFRRVARVHPTFRTPSVAIVLTGALGIVYVAFQTFQQLADQFVVAIFPFYALAAAAGFVLRRRRPPAVGPRAVRVLGYPVVPALFVLATLYMLGNALWQEPLHTRLALLIIRAGAPVYHIWLGAPRRAGCLQV